MSDGTFGLSRRKWTLSNWSWMTCLIAPPSEFSYNPKTAARPGRGAMSRRCRARRRAARRPPECLQACDEVDGAQNSYVPSLSPGEAGEVPASHHSYVTASALAWSSSDWAWAIQSFADCSLIAWSSNAAAFSAALICAARASRWPARLGIDVSIDSYCVSSVLFNALVDAVKRSSPNWPNDALTCTQASPSPSSMARRPIRLCG